MPHEFRVRWQRDGKHPKTQIFQSWDSAVRRVRRLKALDAVKDEFDAYDDMPSIVDGPTLQVREVGEWREHDYQPPAHPFDVDGARSWGEIRDAELRAKKGETVTFLPDF